MVNQESMAFLQLLSKELTLGQIRLPSFPDAVIQIRDALEQEDCDINRITELASLESVLASRLMQSANSAFYNATNRTICDLKQAVMRLGLNEVRNMAIALAVEQIFI
ncbi:MAG: HDOD domain-containing protein, partial [Pseudomonadota bacterium]